MKILPSPYYEEDNITIYHGDCREILPLLAPESIDLVLTDPPYGISYDTSHTKYKHSISRPAVTEDDKPFDPTPLLGFKKLIIWGGNCFSSRLPDSSAWLVWVKIVRQDANIRQSDCELAWTNCVGRARVFTHLWIGAYRDSESGERNFHPTQKPLALMRWCLGLLPKAQTILDPYLGSGTTLVAAKHLGKRGIGIEIEEKYCDISVQRLAQKVMAI